MGIVDRTRSHITLGFVGKVMTPRRDSFPTIVAPVESS